jgi:hypothetical protein
MFGVRLRTFALRLKIEGARNLSLQPSPHFRRGGSYLFGAQSDPDHEAFSRAMTSLANMGYKERQSTRPP